MAGRPFGARDSANNHAPTWLHPTIAQAEYEVDPTFQDCASMSFILFVSYYHCEVLTSPVHFNAMVAPWPAALKC